MYRQKKERTRRDSGCAKRENTFHPLEDQLEREQMLRRELQKKSLMIADVSSLAAATKRSGLVPLSR